MSSHMFVSQFAVCQGSGSNWLTSCCYFISLSAFLSFSIPFQSPGKTPGLQLLLQRKEKKDSSFARKLIMFFFLEFREIYRKIKCLRLLSCQSEKVPSSWGKYGDAFFLSAPLPNSYRVHSLCGFIAHICTYIPVSFDFFVLLPATCLNTTVFEFHEDWLLFSCTE